MKDKLIFFKLKVKSSYNQNVELPAENGFDTLQFYVHDQSIWRIKTFAIDHDIHIHKINLGDRKVDDVVNFLMMSTKNHYGDVIENILTMHLTGPTDQKTAKAFLTENNLNPHLESTDEFAFWNPDSESYQTQSKPL